MTLEDPRHFGELAYCISNAISTDICVLCVHDGSYPAGQLEHIKTVMAGKLGAPIDCICHSHQRLLIDPAGADEHVSFLTISLKHFNQLEGTFDVFDDAQCKAIFEKIYHLLSDAKDIV